MDVLLGPRTHGSHLDQDTGGGESFGAPVHRLGESFLRPA